MALPLPNLDDRTYRELVDEALALIPIHTSEWTNFNSSDPGITLLELFAYLTEMLVYRLNRVTEANQLAFLRLLKGQPLWNLPENRPLADEVRETITRVRSLDRRLLDRAVTCEDFAALALQAGEGAVARAHCLARINLNADDFSDPRQNAPDHVSVIIVPASNEQIPNPSSELLEKVNRFLEPRRLLATKLHVVAPRYVTIGIRAQLVCASDAQPSRVRSDVEKALREYFHPLRGGPNGVGWPFGRSIYISEVYQLLDAVPMVNYVTRVRDEPSGSELDELIIDQAQEKRMLRDADGQLISIDLHPWELVALNLDLVQVAIT